MFLADEPGPRVPQPTYRRRSARRRPLRVSLCLWLLCAVAPVLTYAQPAATATLRGQVVEARTGVPLPAVLVQIEATRQQATSDADGRFSFQSLRPGQYVLSSWLDSFAPSRIEFVLEPREVKNVQLKLEVRPIELTLDVVGRLSRSESTHSPSSTVLSAERIDSLSVSQKTTISDVLLTAVPGMIRADNDFVHARGHEIGLRVAINGVAFLGASTPHLLERCQP